MNPDNPRQCPSGPAELPLADEPLPYWGWCTDGPWCGAFLAKRLSLVPITRIAAPTEIYGVYAIDPVKHLWRWSGKPGFCLGA